MLLQRPYDWRWGVEGERTDWYAGTTLLRAAAADVVAARLAVLSAARSER